MKNSVLLLLVLLPAILGVLFLLWRGSTPKNFRETFSILCAAGLVWFVLSIWGKELSLNIPWIHIPGDKAQIDLQLRWYALSQFIIAALAIFTFLGILFSTKFTSESPTSNQFYGYVFLSEALAFGAVLANNLMVMLFFWEALLITLYLFISLGNLNAYKSAIKALIVAGLADLCLVFAVGMVGFQAETLEMTKIHLNTVGLSGVAFVLMLIGATAKAGIIPFHSWIPSASDDAPTPFMVFIPTVIYKLIGIYLAVRVVIDLFVMDESMKVLVMAIGAVSVLLAMFMAFIQTDIKRMLAYSGIGQVGYMVLGIGTGNPIGIVGGLFHLINYVMYKTGLFYVSGAVEKQTGTTDMRKLGGLGKQMPVTTGAFIICAAALAGFPFLTSGFVSNNIIMEATKESGHTIFLVAAIIGAIFSVAAVLKLGHAVFFGKSNSEQKPVAEAHWTMLVPMVVVALGAIFFGVNYNLPLNQLIKPVLASSIPHGLAEVGFNPFSPFLAVTLVVLLIAVCYHMFGVKIANQASGAAEHFQNMPLLKSIYAMADKGFLDPYVIGKKVGYYVARGLFAIDRGIDWCYQKMIPSVADVISSTRKIHNGLYANYLSWSLGGLAVMIIYLVWFVK